jgi:hypothetical protein
VKATDGGAAFCPFDGVQTTVTTKRPRHKRVGLKEKDKAILHGGMLFWLQKSDLLRA